MEYYKKVDTDTDLSSKKKLHKVEMTQEEYNALEIKNENVLYVITDNKHKSKLLTAKMAREITNEAIRKKIQDTLLPKIKNVAEKGQTNIDCDIPTNIDYQFAIDYIKYLGYEIKHVKTYSNCITINVKW